MSDAFRMNGQVQPEQLNLGTLIDILSQYPPSQRVALGFAQAHSYRGYYDELAFVPEENTTVGEMLKEAKDALGKTFFGYKGGDYKMDKDTPVWLAHWGSTGETIGRITLGLMLGEFDA